MTEKFVLGVNVSHDISAALIKDGVLVCAIAEERLNRIKRFTGGIDENGMTNKHLPHLAIAYCLAAGGIGWTDLTLIVVSTCVVVNYKDYSTRALTKEEVLAQMPRDVDPRKVEIVGHHSGHAASAYYPSGFQDAAVLIADGGGSLVRTQTGSFEERVTIFRGQGNALETVRQFFDGQPSNGYLASGEHASIGDFYQSATVFVGFKGGDEGKTMGLAPYGRDCTNSIFENAVTLEGAKLKIKDSFQFNKRRGSGKKVYDGQFGCTLLPGQPLRSVDRDVAACVQHATERILIRLAQQAYDLTGSKNLCLSGGVALNSVANKKIFDETPFERIFVQPAAGDDGCAIGNALLGWVMLLGQPRRWEMRNAYTGRTYSAQEISAAVEKYKDWVVPVGQGDVVRVTSRLLSERKIVGWFQGGSEFGPRALGHRSILCDPRYAQMKDILNAKVKHREAFRPFAPSILQEFNSEYFELDCESPFMLLIAKVLRPKDVPAITHVDNTARVQTVNRKDNGIYYDLIKAFYEITGVPVLVNTSFNVDGEPIVETPEDAIRCFIGTNMDRLVLGDVVLTKRQLKCKVFQIWPRDLKRSLYRFRVALVGRFPFLKAFKKTVKAKGRGDADHGYKVPG